MQAILVGQRTRRTNRSCSAMAATSCEMSLSWWHERDMGCWLDCCDVPAVVASLHTRYWGKSGTAACYLCDGDFPNSTPAPSSAGWTLARVWTIPPTGPSPRSMRCTVVMWTPDLWASSRADQRRSARHANLIRGQHALISIKLPQRCSKTSDYCCKKMKISLIRHTPKISLFWESSVDFRLIYG